MLVFEGKSAETSHSYDTAQMLELAAAADEIDGITPCASCEFKQAEDRHEFKRKRMRSHKAGSRQTKRRKVEAKSVSDSITMMTRP